MNKQNRFQYQPFYIKLYRFRWYLLIPFETFKIWIYNWKEESFCTCWHICKGLAQMRMNWMYDWEDIKRRVFKEK